MQTCPAHSPHRPPIPETEPLNTDLQTELNQIAQATTINGTLTKCNTIRYFLRSHLRIHKSLASTGEDFFLFCDPPVTPAFAFLLTDAAAAIGGLGTDAVTIGESVASHAARLAAGGSPSPGTGSPAHSAPAAAVSAAVAADSLKVLFRITLGSTAEFSTQYSL